MRSERAQQKSGAGRWLRGLAGLMGVVVLLAAVLLLWQAELPRRLLSSMLPAQAQQQILYLSADGQKRPQIYARTLRSDSATRLTSAEHGVGGYAVAPDGSTIAYSTGLDDSGNAIWLVDADGENARRVLACKDALCADVVWTPDNRRIVYEHHELTFSGTPSDQSQLWWLEPATGETVRVFADEELFAQGAGFSHDGRWLSFVVPDEEVTRLYNLETERTLDIPNQVGAQAAWHRSDNRLVSSDIVYQGEQFAVHLYLVDVESGEMTDISDQEETDDGLPAWSPDGEQLAFGRKIPRASIGRQIWITPLNAEGSRQLTADPESNFGPPQWSPDGRWLLTQRFRLAEPQKAPSIWLLNVQTGELRQVAPLGYAPAWLP